MTEPVSDETPIAALFARDPLKHTEQDIDRIIAKLRESRSAFKVGGPRSAPAKKLTAKEEAVTKLSLNLDLGDL